MPLVLGELLAGVILGPTLLNIWRFSFFANTQAVAGNHAISLPAAVHVLAQIGVVILMFLAGLETDTELMKATAAPAFWAAAGGVLLPLVGGAVFVHALGFGWGEGIFIGTVLTATSVSITAQTLMNMNRLKIGHGRLKSLTTGCSGSSCSSDLPSKKFKSIAAHESAIASTHEATHPRYALRRFCGLAEVESPNVSMPGDSE